MTIKVGDLVAIIKPRKCGCSSSVGRVFVVRDTEITRVGGLCMTCCRETFAPGAAVAQSPDGFWTEAPRLRRIPPLSDLTGIDETLREKVPA